MNFRSEWVNDNRHQGSSCGNHRREKIDKASGFVGNDVFLEDELEQISDRLQGPLRPYAIGPEATLNKPEHAALSQHRISDHRHHYGEGNEDADEHQDEML